MYHIKNDLRQQSSAMRLVKGLTECLRDKNMSEISVSDLCKASNVSRSTFYRMFDTPIDLLEYTSDIYVSKAVNDYSEEVFKGPEDFVMFSLIYWKNHTDILEAVVNCGRLDIVKKSFDAHSNKLIPFLESEFDDVEIDYINTATTSLITSLLSVWIRRGKKETPVQLFELYRKFYSMTRNLSE